MVPHSIADEQAGFLSQPAYEMRRRMSKIEEVENWAGLSLAAMFCGLAVIEKHPCLLEIGICTHDGTYSTDYCMHHLHIPENTSHTDRANMCIKHIIEQLKFFSTEHTLKFVGAGITEKSLEITPTLPSVLWKDMDIVPMVYKVAYIAPPSLANGVMGGEYEGEMAIIDVDEQADSAARKCTKDFGPGLNPCLTIGYRNQVFPDTGGRARLVCKLDEYQKTVMGEGTWNSAMKYAKELRMRKIKIAYFSSTPQGGGVALMRHALLRFFKMAGVQAAWYVPKPHPRVFRITKTNHNILQGVADPNLRLTKSQSAQIDEWILANAERSWLSPGGPLAVGGADVCIIDDPQMPALIPLIRRARPHVPIIYRSHIEIRSDLVAQKGSPQEEVWSYLWNYIKHADVFVSHPMESFVPNSVPLEKLALMPASTDWLDGLNKVLRVWDLRYYHHNFRTMCSAIHMAKLQFPQRNYIIQVARFDPSKGIPDAIDAFCKLRKKLDNELPFSRTPQLLICGHGAVDDPDASIIYDETMQLLESDKYARWANDIIVMRIGPSDQMLNALLTNATLALQLSTREGFEVKVSEALHHGKPTIATLAGGIPLQIQHGKTGFLVRPSDTDAVAGYMYKLWMDRDLREKISKAATKGVSDEAGTVGNALCWMYLATKLSTKGLSPADADRDGPGARWVFDLARKEAREPWREGEPRLPRGVFVERRKRELDNVVEEEMVEAVRALGKGGEEEEEEEEENVKVKVKVRDEVEEALKMWTEQAYAS
ncbi:UDP-Glycosyltransferase/glycogen phosphorylase [Terfezia boudieri ATCC MYA-4762]|uniref:UDP-Glycosyltransferase/glycogen phosphorylase n=1 Tax=Terfezia boudieri ATCC MYA-4762 TaxID=1051890 RepID=A0A3N4M0E8_9PEZI|nr:UDP-Glycosyltransferase/glycogen phosphorylase [Terfezia boudieri ATCC MYA-4762]